MKNFPGYVVAEQDPKVRRAVFESLTTCASRQLTICEQFRFIYDTVAQIKDEDIKKDLTEKIIDAFHMAKKMNSRLAHYKRKYIDKTGHRGKSLIRLQFTKEREKLRLEREAKK